MTKEEAIKELDHVKRKFEEANVFINPSIDIAINMAIEALREQPTGEWIKATGVAPPEFTGRYVCSNCGHYALMNMPYGSRQELSHFCPNCRADMRGTENE